MPCCLTPDLVVVVLTINSSLQCSPWSQDRLQQLWRGRLPQEENKKKQKIIHTITETNRTWYTSDKTKKVRLPYVRIKNIYIYQVYIICVYANPTGLNVLVVFCLDFSER